MIFWICVGYFILLAFVFLVATKLFIATRKRKNSQDKFSRISMARKFWIMEYIPMLFLLIYAVELVQGSAPKNAAFVCFPLFCLLVLSPNVVLIYDFFKKGMGKHDV